MPPAVLRYCNHAPMQGTSRQCCTQYQRVTGYIYVKAQTVSQFKRSERECTRSVTRSHHSQVQVRYDAEPVVVRQNTSSARCYLHWRVGPGSNCADRAHLINQLWPPPRGMLDRVSSWFRSADNSYCNTDFRQVRQAMQPQTTALKGCAVQHRNNTTCGAGLGSIRRLLCGCCAC